MRACVCEGACARARVRACVLRAPVSLDAVVADAHTRHRAADGAATHQHSPDHNECCNKRRRQPAATAKVVFSPGCIYFGNVLRPQSTNWDAIVILYRCMLPGWMYNARQFELAGILMLENVNKH